MALWVTRSGAAITTRDGGIVSTRDRPAGTLVSSPTLRYVQTTGSISKYSTTLTVASATGLSVGDDIVIEIGGEAGAGLRGTMGVGGAWPPRVYPTEALMEADTSQPLNTYAWVEATGDVYQWSPSFNMGNWWQLSAGDYHYKKAVPRSLRARILQISGPTITINNQAQVDVTNANVYYDNRNEIRWALTGGADRVEFPAGTYYASERVEVLNRDDMVITGQGMSGANVTKLIAPKGVPGPEFDFDGCNRVIVENLWHEFNALDDGYGLYDHTDYSTDKPGQMQGVIYRNGEDNTARYMTCVNSFSHAVTSLYAPRTHFHHINVVRDQGFQAYTQWMIQVVYSGDSIVEDCDIDSEELVSGYNAWACDRPIFRRLTGRNCLMAMNGSGDWTVDDVTINWEAGAKGNTHISVPIFLEVSKNQDNSAATLLDGGTASNLDFNLAGALHASGSPVIPRGVSITAANPNITVDSLDFEAQPGAGQSIGFVASSTGTVIQNSEVYGEDASYHTDYGALVYNEFGPSVSVTSRTERGGSTGGSIDAKGTGSSGNVAEFITLR